MTRVATDLPDDVVEALDDAARRLRGTREEVVRQAIERYLDDFNDLSRVLERLQDGSDPELDWQAVRGALLDQD